MTAEKEAYINVSILPHSTNGLDIFGAILHETRGI